MNSTITDVPGITAGHFTNLVDGTGCTVVIAEDGAIAVSYTHLTLPTICSV